MADAADAGSISLYIPTPSVNNIRQSRSLSEDGQILLYQTYEDYFNMEEENTSPMSTVKLWASTPLASPPLEPTTPDGVSTTFMPFFFVLSASSPSGSETASTPISPLQAGDIPEALSRLLPQPSNSLLEVINVTGLSESLGPENKEQDVSSLSMKPNPTLEAVNPSATSKTAPIRPLPRPKPPSLRLRDSTAPVLMSQAFIEAHDPPASSTAEFTPFKALPSLPSPSQVRRRPDPGHIPDAESRITYPSVPSASRLDLPLRPRVRETQSMEAVSPISRTPLTAGGHTRGRSSPFPLPIQFSFAPTSVPGSGRTPYNYF